MEKQTQDLIIIGGGIMGLCTAYAASYFTNNIILLEKSRIGNPETASFGYTRSIRNDYLDPFYARLAYEARRLWLELERKATEPLIIQCGCLNIAKESVTPGLDVEAGFLYLPTVTQTLLEILQQRQVNIMEDVEVVAVEQRTDEVRVVTSTAGFSTKSLVITAGLGTNEVLRRITGCSMQFSLIPDRPSQCKYFIPPAEKRELFTAEALPVFAYLDIGIYGHPIYTGKTPGVKIGFYNPPDVRKSPTYIHDVHGFVDECMPALRDAEAIDVTEVDQCFYDLVPDDTFILGNLPTFPRIFVGVGWRGTGYKYAPWVGQTLMQLALQDGTVYDIGRFSPQRFVSDAS